MMGDPFGGYGGGHGGGVDDDDALCPDGAVSSSQGRRSSFPLLFSFFISRWPPTYAHSVPHLLYGTLEFCHVEKAQTYWFAHI